MPREFDVIVIGAGAAGENAAGRAAGHGLAVAIVEQELVGGDCSYWACMPSKALLRPGEVLRLAERVPGTRRAVTGGIDVEAALSWRDEMSSRWDDRWQVQWLEENNVTLLRGHGRLSGERQVTVIDGDGQVTAYQARRAVVVATGTVAAVPPIDGMEDVGAWTSRELTATQRVPGRLLVLGGGAVGVEMAQAWRWLGSQQVSLVEMEDRLLAEEEPFVGEELGRAFQADGIEVLTGKAMVKVGREEDGSVVATLDDGSQLVGDELLVAVGRRPVTEDVGLETVGLEPRDYLEVDDQLRVKGVAGGWLYAVGDVNGRTLLTHMGKYQARMAGDHIAGKEVVAWADHRAVPRVVFTDPRLAAVGLTERQARDQGLPVRTVSHPTGGVAGTSLLGEGMSGTSQLIIDEDRRVVVGATFTGPIVVGELLHAATVAIVGEVTLERLWHAVPQFPTVSEVWLRLLEAYGL
ncbi:MAG: NAD(P)/FAD-dependent oxidoreductase [Actinomycetota bacterium]|nr:NAD(P)/FAD-dependent oxidoreductase [Actinomycetota bacterium]